MPPSNFRLAICGGGIGGLTLAAILLKYSKQDIQIDMYEAKDKFAEIGAGVIVWKRTWYIFQLLGLDEALGKMALTPPVDEPSPGFQFRKADQEDGFNIRRIVFPFASITVHRAEMLKLLSGRLPEDFPVHFSKQLVRYTEDPSGTVTMFFADGSTAEADAIIGADGLKSPVREAMYQHLAEAVEKSDPQKANSLLAFKPPYWTGTYAYRTVFNTEKLMEIAPGHQATEIPTSYWGKNMHGTAYPILNGKLVNVALTATDIKKEGTRLEGHYMTEVSLKEMADLLIGWDIELQHIMSCAEKASRWAVCQVRDLPTFSSSRAAILGDAAHAMCPNLGAGAGQAMEDAYILGRLLSDDRVTLSNLKVALQVYDRIRRPLATRCQDLSRKAGRCYDFNFVPDSVRDAGVELTSAEGLKLLSDEVYGIWEWNWTDEHDEMWLDAEKLLDELTSTAVRDGESGKTL